VYNYTGQIDINRTTPGNLSAANALLNPAIGELQLLASQLNIPFDFWEFVNWVYVNFYWTMLSDLGQIAPINYIPRPAAPLTRLMNVDFNARRAYNSTYNILLNSELYHKQTSFLTTTLLPLLNKTISAKFDPLDNKTNMFSPQIATFIRSYMCEIRQWKDPFGFMFSVFTTIWVFTLGPMAFMRLVLAWLEASQNPAGFVPLNDSDF
jgi:hypothetical protein